MNTRIVALTTIAAYLIVAITMYVLTKPQPLQPGEVRMLVGSEDTATPQFPSSPDREATPAEVPYEITVIATGLEIPWSMAFTSPERLLVTERPGRIRAIINDQLQDNPLVTLPDVIHAGEGGLMGLAVDPDYANNHYLYVSYVYESAKTRYVKVVRLIDEGTTIRTDRTIFDRIPAAQYHVGNRLAFGPDNKLYITTGDALQKAEAQNTDSLAGKILRINADGSIPTDNPFTHSPVWSIGHRNPQGIDWDASSQLYSSEHGPSGFDGPGGGDEINHIIPGANYGWPLVSHERSQTGLVAPLTVFTPAEAPAGLVAYTGDLFPQFQNNIFVATLRGTGIIRATVDPTNPDRLLSVEKMSDISHGRIRDIIEAPDGTMYFATSNRDGRGDPSTSDDRIFRIQPKK